MQEFVVVKRGDRGVEPYENAKIITRLEHLCENLNYVVKLGCFAIASATTNSIKNNISTKEIDNILAANAEMMRHKHPDFGILAARILVNNHHKSTKSSFSETFLQIAKEKPNYLDPHAVIFVRKFASQIDNMIVHGNDYKYDYFGFCTLLDIYLLKLKDANGVKQVLERPQYALMRIALCLYRPILDKPKKSMTFSEYTSVMCDGSRYHTAEQIEDLEESEYESFVGELTESARLGLIRDVRNTEYQALVDNLTPEDAFGYLEPIKRCYISQSQLYYTHATPTIFNSSTANSQLLSCFLLGTDDSIEGIMKTVYNSALISKRAGGIGIHMSNIRSEGADIVGTEGKSNGLVPQLQIYNANMRCWNQGGKRPGSAAIYVEPWHGDIRKILTMRLHSGIADKPKDLFYALWIPDLFFKRVRSGAMWSLFSENLAPGLSNVCGAEFEALYEQYERDGLAIDTLPAREIFDLIAKSLRESGLPYICAKDHGNHKSNQKNIGTIKSSNLCAEIFEYSSDKEYACCTLGSLSLPAFVRQRPTPDGIVLEYDFDKLHEMAKILATNLDRIIDRNDYPVEECRISNMKYRPIGMGIQGLADVFMIFHEPYDSPVSRQLQIDIMETIYHAAIETSCELARIHRPYAGFKGSPMSEGKFQFDLWREFSNFDGADANYVPPMPRRYDWNKLRADVMKWGVRNSLSVALMPTATSSQLLGNSECFEAISSNAFSRRTGSGIFPVFNKYMQRHFIQLGIWSEPLFNQIVANKGSVQKLNIDPRLKEIYRTIWEIPQKSIMQMSADRGVFVCQSQSLNISLPDADHKYLYAMMMYGWSIGLKTINYYVRSRPKVDPLAVNIAETSGTPKKLPAQQIPEINIWSGVTAPAASPPEPEPDACPIGCTSCQG